MTGGVLIVDTETTGLPITRGYDQYFAPHVLECYESSRLLQLSWVLCARSDDLAVLDTHDVIVHPAGQFEVRNHSIHGITQARAEACGVPVTQALAALLAVLPRAACIVAHNAAFDRNILLAELTRVGMDGTALAQKPWVCTMQGMRELVGALGIRGRVKPPRLHELYEWAVGRHMQHAHNSLHDVLNLREALAATLARPPLPSGAGADAVAALREQLRLPRQPQKSVMTLRPEGLHCSSTPSGPGEVRREGEHGGSGGGAEATAGSAVGLPLPTADGVTATA
jgi:DNA polymerase III epsilon subunit-like protein